MYTAVLASKVLWPLLLTLALRPCGDVIASPGGGFIFFLHPMRTNASTPPAIAVLPRAPHNASPVPGLTSLYHKAYRGPYGDPGYPGNCGGELIKDLLLYFRPGGVFDPMTGSGTCADVCKELGIEHRSTDLREGFDACDPRAFHTVIARDFVWLHPPYWRQKVYSDDARDLSNCPTLGDFLDRYGRLIRNCVSVLKPGGKLAILMGFCDFLGYVMLFSTVHLLRAGWSLAQHNRCAMSQRVLRWRLT